MKKNILLPTDFSDNAWSAMVYALKLYKDEYCTFYFLHSTFAIDAVSRSYITTHYVDEQLKIAERRLTELKVQTEIANANANHSFETLSSEDELKIAVSKAVKEHAIDIVVMGTKGTTDAIEYVMGSNTIKVIKKIKDCPVLIVPDAYEFVEPEQITFPTDYNRFYDEKELRPLKEMADLFNSKIRVVHINIEKKLTEVQEYNRTMLGSFLANYEHSMHWLPDYTKKSKAIATFIEDLEIDMLAMVNYNHGLFESILNEPVIKKLAFHPTVPMLVIPE
jgi:nucleotide-binding universal stress UspA family protein